MPCTTTLVEIFGCIQGQFSYESLGERITKISFAKIIIKHQVAYFFEM